MKIYQKGWFWFLVLLTLIALNQFVFTWFFKLSYFAWYQKNGSLITAAFALVTLTWDINKNTGLVSANPRHYVGSIQQLIGAQINSFGAIGNQAQRRSQNQSVHGSIILDNLVFIIFALLLVLINVLWLILVVPIQYFFVVILGGPARIYLSSPIKALAKFDGEILQTREIPITAEKPADWMDLSIANKSVTLTYAIIALVLAVAKYFM